MTLTVGDLGREGREHGLEHVRQRVRLLSPEELDVLQNNWDFLAREDQKPPPGPWTIWLYLAGRGSGKTRAGIEWVRNKIKQGSRRIGLIAPSIAALRDVLIDGESGILAHAWEYDHDNAGRLMGRPMSRASGIS